MQNRTRTIASAVFATLLIDVISAFVGGDIARGADECLTEPKGQTPVASHWRYRTDHATHRNCWYLKDESAKADPVASPQPSSSAESVSATSPAISPSTANAHAELPAATMVAPQSPGVSVAAPQALPTVTEAVPDRPRDPPTLVRVNDDEPSTTGDGDASPTPAFAPLMDAQTGAMATDPMPAPSADSDAIGALRLVMGLVFIAAGLCTIIAALLVRFAALAQVRRAMASEQDRRHRAASMTQAG